MKRIIFDLALFLSLFILPWWITALFAFFGMFLFKQFYEFLVVSLIIYSIFSYPSDRVVASSLWYPLIICGIFIVIQYIKSRMILYKNEI